MTGAWDAHYATLTEPALYGDPASYELAAAFVAGCSSVEDWGCGGGGLRQFLDPAQPYKGIDGSCTPFADLVADLTHYRSEADAIVLRHVLEHSHAWQRILHNARASFRSKLCVILFTPTGDTTRVLATEPDYGDVPVIAFALDDLIDVFPPGTVKIETETIEGSHYGVETILKITR